MQICDKHWKMMRAAIEERGLSGLVAQSGEALMERTLAEADGSATPAGYDPLAACNWMVMGRAIESGGLYLMNGDFCPICEAMKHTAHLPRQGETEPVGEAWVENHWIAGPADAALGYCREHNLVPPEQ
jgi:hypothetical protein